MNFRRTIASVRWNVRVSDGKYQCWSSVRWKVWLLEEKISVLGEKCVCEMKQMTVRVVFDEKLCHLCLYPRKRIKCRRKIVSVRWKLWLSDVKYQC